MSSFRDWTAQFSRNVNTAANRLDDKAVGWMLEVFKTESQFDALYECESDFITLDRKLAKSLSDIIPKYLRDRLTNKETAYQMKGQHIKGRQILQMICREFDVNQYIGFMCRIEDLSMMQFHSDAKMQHFLNRWDEICDQLDLSKIEGPTMAKMVQKKIISSKIMATDIHQRPKGYLILDSVTKFAKMLENHQKRAENDRNAHKPKNKHQKPTTKH